MNTQLLVVRATGVIDGRISTRLRQSLRKSLIQLLLGETSRNGPKMTGYLNGRGGGGRRPFHETGESQWLISPVRTGQHWLIYGQETLLLQIVHKACDLSTCPWDHNNIYLA